MKPDGTASQRLLDNDLVPRSWSGLACERVARVHTRSRCLGALWEPAFPGHESLEMITFEYPFVGYSERERH